MQESGSNGFDDGMHCVTPTVPLLPALLKAEGFATHALGKWDVGYVQRHCLPTTRGFDTFLGYQGDEARYYSHKAFGTAADTFCDLADADAATGIHVGDCRDGAYSTDLYAARLEAIL